MNSTTEQIYECSSSLGPNEDCWEMDQVLAFVRRTLERGDEVYIAPRCPTEEELVRHYGELWTLHQQHTGAVA